MALFPNNWNMFVAKNPTRLVMLPCPQDQAAITHVLDQMDADTDALAKAVYDGYKKGMASLALGIHPDNPAKIPAVTSSDEDPTIHISIYPYSGAKKHHVYVTGPVDGKYTYVKTTCPG